MDPIKGLLKKVELVRRHSIVKSHLHNALSGYSHGNKLKAITLGINNINTLGLLHELSKNPSS